MTEILNHLEESLTHELITLGVVSDMLDREIEKGSSEELLKIKSLLELIKSDLNNNIDVVIDYNLKKETV